MSTPQALRPCFASSPVARRTRRFAQSAAVIWRSPRGPTTDAAIWSSATFPRSGLSLWRKSSKSEFDVRRRMPSARNGGTHDRLTSTPDVQSLGANGPLGVDCGRLLFWRRDGVHAVYNILERLYCFRQNRNELQKNALNRLKSRDRAQN